MKNISLSKVFLLFLFSFCFSFNTFSQPYIDLLQARLLGGGTKPQGFGHFYLGGDIPIKIKNETYLLLSPFAESWYFDSTMLAANDVAVNSLAYPIGIIHPLNDKWGLTCLAIYRSNGEKLFQHGSDQFGAVGFGTYQRKENQKLKVGMYINRDFFGWFVMPLAGIDWKINKHNYLYGLLPGKLTYMHGSRYRFSYGVNFRAITNSYRYGTDQYLRIDDNQLSIFMDTYTWFKLVCWTLEGGLGMYRKLGIGYDNSKPFYNYNWEQSGFIQLSGSIRFWMEKKEEVQ